MMQPGRLPMLGAILALLLVGGAALAQQTISEVAFEGLSSVSQDALRLAIRTKPGDVLDPARLQADLEALTAMGLFNPDRDRTYIRLERGDAGAKVVFHLTEYARITAIVCDGNEALSDDEIIAAIGKLLVVGDVYNLRLVQRAIDSIVEAYAARGLEAIVSSARIDAAGKVVLSIVEARVGEVRIDLVPPVTIDTEALRAWVGIQPGSPLSRRELADLSARLRKSGLFDQVAIVPPFLGPDAAKLTLTIQASLRPWPRPNQQSVSLVNPQRTIGALHYYRPLPSAAYSLEIPVRPTDLEAADQAAAAAPADPQTQLSLVLAYCRAGDGRAERKATEVAARVTGLLSDTSTVASRAAIARVLILAGQWRDASVAAHPLLDAEDPTIRGAAVLLETCAVQLAADLATGAGQTMPGDTPLEWALTYLTEMADLRSAVASPSGQGYARALSAVTRYMSLLGPEKICAELSEFGRCCLLLDLLAPLNANLGIDTNPPTSLTSGLSDRRVLDGLRVRAADPADVPGRYALGRLLMIRALVGKLGGPRAGAALGLPDDGSVCAAALEAERIFRQLIGEAPERFRAAKEDIGTCLVIAGKADEGRQLLYEAVADGTAREAVGLIFSTAEPEGLLRQTDGAPTVEQARANVYGEVQAFVGKLAPPPPAARHLLAMAALWAGDEAGAQQAIAPLVAAGAETVDGLAITGYIALKQGQADAAIQAYTRAAALSNASYIKDALGLALLAAGRTDDALAQFASIRETWFGSFPL